MNTRSLPLAIITILAALSCSDETTAPPVDRTNPTAPTGLAAIQISRAHVQLTWQPSTDNVAVTNYTTKAYDVNNGRYLLIIPSTGPECVDSLALPWEPMRYNVVAWDAAGNGQTSGFLTFVVIPTAADVAGTWSLASCDPAFSPGLSVECADALTFTVNSDSTITGTSINMELIAPKGGNVYERTTIPSTSISGRFTGQTIHLTVAPVTGADRNLTGGTIDITVASRPPSGPAWRLRQAQGTYSFTGNKYSTVDSQWFNAYNNGTIRFARSANASSLTE